VRPEAQDQVEPSSEIGVGDDPAERYEQDPEIVVLIELLDQTFDCLEGLRIDLGGVIVTRASKGRARDLLGPREATARIKGLRLSVPTAKESARTSADRVVTTRSATWRTSSMNRTDAFGTSGSDGRARSRSRSAIKSIKTALVPSSRT
jgi:hypothetical protein